MNKNKEDIPVTDQERQRVADNLEKIKKTKISPLMKTENKIKSFCVGYDKDRKPIYEDRQIPCTSIDESKLDKGYFDDHINEENVFELCSYLRAISAGMTHREARFYMLYAKGETPLFK